VGTITKISRKSILKRAAKVLSKKVTNPKRATLKLKAKAVKKEVKSKLKISKKKPSIKKIVKARTSKPIKPKSKTVKAKAKPTVKKSAKKVTAKPKAVKAKTKSVKKTVKSSAKKIRPKSAAKPKAKVTKSKVKAKKSAAKPKKTAAKKKPTKKVDKFVPLAPLPPKPKVNAFKDERLRLYLEKLVGEEGMTIVKKIHGKEVSDVDLAEKMDMKPNIIRKHLYKLYEANVVTYRRHRSKTGWYTYYWQLHPERITIAIDAEKDMYAKELEQVLEYEVDNHFYECGKLCTRAVFEEAIQREFKCPRCEERLEFTDNHKRISELQGQIDQFRAVDTVE